MEWGNPDIFEYFTWVAVACVLVIAAEWIKSARIGKIVSQLDGRPISTLSPFMRFLKLCCLISAIVLLIISLGEPRVEDGKVEVKSRGADIVIAMDVSDSMLAKDIKPNRLEKAKLELQNLVEIARGDRIGVVAFAGEAFIQVPLTVDLSAVKIYLRALDPSSIPVPGTSIEKAIAMSVNLFPKEEGNKSIILLTDGEDSGGDPLLAAEAAADMGIRIFTIGLGTEEGEVIPVKTNINQGFKRDLKGNVVISKLDEKTLRKIASITGAEYFRSQRGLLEVSRIYRLIRSQGSRDTGSGWTVNYAPQYRKFVLPAFLLLLLHLMISENRRRDR